LLCHQFFQPYRTVKTQQWVCRRLECQLLRKKLNQLDWLEKHPVDYEKWYQDYGKAWRQKNPNYQQRYRERKKAKQKARQSQASAAQQILKPLLDSYQAEKKDELTKAQTKINSDTIDEKKDSLSRSFYLLKGKGIVLLSLGDEKKTSYHTVSIKFIKVRKKTSSNFVPFLSYIARRASGKEKSHAQTTTDSR
jgi:hypothetical protein